MASKQRVHRNNEAVSKTRSGLPGAQGGDLNAQQSYPAAISRRASGATGSLAPQDVLRLQRTIGNRAVSRLLSRTHLDSAETSAIQTATPAPESAQRMPLNRAGVSNDVIPQEKQIHPEREQGTLVLNPARQTGLSAAVPFPIIQRTAGILWKEKTGFVVYSKGSHGPYTIRNISKIPREYLRQNEKVDYTNMGDGSVVVNSVGGQNITTEGYDEVRKKQKTKDTLETEVSPIDTEYELKDNLQLPETEKIEGKERPWLKGDEFKVDFGKDRVVTVDSGKFHDKLHTNAPTSGTGFRGNSVTLSWTLYYEDESEEIQEKDFQYGNFNTFHSADFGKYSDKDLNEMYALGRVITGGSSYNQKDKKQVAAAKYHSERDFVVKANRVDFVNTLAKSVNQFAGETGIPKLLIIQLHSHKLRICSECYQFLDAFMDGGWIADLKDLVQDGDEMEVRMLTSADDIHSALSSKVDESYEKEHTFTVGNFPKILNMTKYPL